METFIKIIIGCFVGKKIIDVLYNFKQKEDDKIQKMLHAVETKNNMMDIIVDNYMKKLKKMK